MPSTSSKDFATRIGKVMTWGAWLAGLALLTVYFNGILERHNNPNPDPVAIIAEGGAAAIQLKRNRYGHYVTGGTINDQPVVFLVDTGATDVAVPGDLARRLDLKRGAPSISRTANGDVRTYDTTIDRLDLGGLAARDIRASILPGMHDDQVLLGMSYLKHFELIQRGDTLTIRRPRRD